jgi:RNA polymerase sigma-70 factor (ECF subfamily)
MESSKLLLQQIKEDNQLALKSIFNSYYNSVYSSVFRIIQESNLAEDLTQEVFIRLWEKRKSIEINGELGPYLRRMAVNEALGHIRKNKKFAITDQVEELDKLSSYYDAETELNYKELSTAVQAALNKLPSKCRVVFNLSRFEGLSYKEISEQLEISIKTVENQIGKALKVMRENLKDYLTSFLLIVLSNLIGGFYIFCINCLEYAAASFSII